MAFSDLPGKNQGVWGTGAPQQAEKKPIDEMGQAFNNFYRTTNVVIKDKKCSKRTFLKTHGTNSATKSLGIEDLPGVRGACYLEVMPKLRKELQRSMWAAARTRALNK